MNTFEQVRDVTAEVLGTETEEVTMDSDFRNDLDADSLDIIELMMAFEESIGDAIPDDMQGKLNTVRDVVEYIDKNFKDTLIK